MLTVKKLQDAKKELLKRGGAIYVVQSAGKVEVWVNSAGYSAVSMGTHVIQILDEGQIKYDNVFYQSKNQEMSLQEFCDMVNNEYCQDKLNTVTLYKITQTIAFQMSEQGEGYSLEPYSSNSTYYEGEDDGGKDYILPEGYTVAEAMMGETQIYNSKGEHCQIIKKFNSPCLITSEGEIMLAQVKD